MTSRQLYEDWKKEEAAARMEGWDFSHLRGRYEEGRDIPWDYDAIVRACRRDALLRLHRQLEQTGMLEGTTHRFLIVAQK